MGREMMSIREDLGKEENAQNALYKIFSMMKCQNIKDWYECIHVWILPDALKRINTNIHLTIQ